MGQCPRAWLETGLNFKIPKMQDAYIHRLTPPMQELSRFVRFWSFIIFGERGLKVQFIDSTKTFGMIGWKETTQAMYSPKDDTIMISDEMLALPPRDRIRMIFHELRHRAVRRFSVGVVDKTDLKRALDDLIPFNARMKHAGLLELSYREENINEEYDANYFSLIAEYVYFDGNYALAEKQGLLKALFSLTAGEIKEKLPQMADRLRQYAKIRNEEPFYLLKPSNIRQYDYNYNI